MQFALNPEIEGLSQFYSNFLYDTIIVLIIGFIEVALRSGRLNLVSGCIAVIGMTAKWLISK